MTPLAAAYDVFDPKDLARIEGLELLASRVVDGLLSGKHRSQMKGGSAEFTEHRGYVAGDPFRLIVAGVRRVIASHLLQPDDIGLRARDRIDRALEVVAAGAVDAVVDVEGHDLQRDRCAVRTTGARRAGSGWR